MKELNWPAILVSLALTALMKELNWPAILVLLTLVAFWGVVALLK